jgi:hypothetical protein
VNDSVDRNNYSLGAYILKISKFFKNNGIFKIKTRTTVKMFPNQSYRLAYVKMNKWCNNIDEFINIFNCTENDQYIKQTAIETRKNVQFYIDHINMYNTTDKTPEEYIEIISQSKTDLFHKLNSIKANFNLEINNSNYTIFKLNFPRGSPIEQAYPKPPIFFAMEPWARLNTSEKNIQILGQNTN